MNSLALLVALALTGAAPGPLPPIDQCTGDPSFAAFRDTLTGVVRRRDTARLLELVDDNVQVDFGPDGLGKAAFIAAWRLDKPSQSDVWGEIEALLRLGCTAHGGTIVMPSFFEQVPPSADPLEAYLAIVPGAALRAKPSEDSRMVARLNWDVMTLEEVASDLNWYLMRLDDGRRGYVHRNQVRNLLDYRLVASRIDGTWRITALVAGD